ncbi:MAG: hypothetical protein ACK56I_21085, partial [bacterium]
DTLRTLATAMESMLQGCRTRFKDCLSLCCCTAVHLRCPTARPALLRPTSLVEGQGPFQSFAEQARRSSLEQQALQGPSARELGLTQSGCMTADTMSSVDIMV